MMVFVYLSFSERELNREIDDNFKCVVKVVRAEKSNGKSEKLRFQDEAKETPTTDVLKL